MTIQTYINTIGTSFWRTSFVLLLVEFLECIVFLICVSRLHERWSSSIKHIFTIFIYLAVGEVLALFHLSIVLNVSLHLGLWVFYLCSATDLNWKEALYHSALFCLCIELGKLLCRDGLLAVTIARLLPGLTALQLNLALLVIYLLYLGILAFIFTKYSIHIVDLNLSALELFPLLFPLLLYMLIRFLQFFYLDQLTDQLWTFIDLVLLGVVVCAVLVINTTFQLLTAQEEKKEALYREMLLRQQKQQFLMQEETIRAVNRRYHDLKHYIYAEEHNRTCSNDFIQELKKELEPYEAIRNTGNEFLDTLLVDYTMKAQEQDIRIVPYIDARGLDFVSVPDLCALFGNAMDNAMQATARVPYVNMREISIKITNENDLFIMRFHNYFDGELRWKGGKLLTTKAPENDGHGYGLENIRMIAEKYGGSVSIETGDNDFSLYILLTKNGHGF